MPTPLFLAVLLVAACAAPKRAAESPHYALYFHGRIIEDHGLPAVHPEFGTYEYAAILDRLRGVGFVVLSEVRGRDADPGTYADRAVRRIDSLVASGVSPGHITLIGASKGAYIASLASHRARRPELNLVLLAGCSASTVAHMRAQGIDLYGHLLAIRDVADTTFAGPCAALAAASEGVGRSRDLVVELGVGHGLVYRPYAAWVDPVAAWAFDR